MNAIMTQNSFEPARPAVILAAWLLLGCMAGFGQNPRTKTNLNEQLPAAVTNGLDEAAEGVATNGNASVSTQTNDPIARIRTEGLEHSQVMETLTYLSDVIGPRLTGSPNLKRANEWTRQKLE